MTLDPGPLILGQYATAHEMYDVERKRQVKDLPLLKTLKSTIDAINVLTGKLQEAEAQENWDHTTRSGVDYAA